MLEWLAATPLLRWSFFNSICLHVNTTELKTIVLQYSSINEPLEIRKVPLRAFSWANFSQQSAHTGLMDFGRMYRWEINSTFLLRTYERCNLRTEWTASCWPKPSSICTSCLLMTPILVSMSPTSYSPQKVTYCLYLWQDFPTELLFR